jgi:hypothetical protein
LKTVAFAGKPIGAERRHRTGVGGLVSVEQLRGEEGDSVVPNGSEGSIWMSGTAPAADNSGNIYRLDANGDFGTVLDGNGFPATATLATLFLKISSSGDLEIRLLRDAQSVGGVWILNLR